MDDKLKQKLAALRAVYAQSLPGLVEGLADAVRAWRAAPVDAALQAEVKRLAHRLTGTSGSYGFSELSEAARAIEELVVRDPDDRSRSELDAALDRAVQAASAAVAGGQA